MTKFWRRWEKMMRFLLRFKEYNSNMSTKTQKTISFWNAKDLNPLILSILFSKARKWSTSWRWSTKQKNGKNMPYLLMTTSWPMMTRLKLTKKFSSSSLPLKASSTTFKALCLMRLLLLKKQKRSFQSYKKLILKK